MRQSVFLVAIALYFFLACLASWIALFPAGRTAVVRAMTQAGARFNMAVARALRRHGDALASTARTVSALWRRAWRLLRRHALASLIGALALVLPPVLALLASNKNMLGGFDAPSREMNVQVATLLQGEQLVPPRELPPLVFATAEVEQLRPMLASASRNWRLLNSDYAQRLLVAFKIMQDKYGYQMAILEGYRSPERQDMLAAIGPQVTNAAAYQSWHQYGLAADCAFLREGRLVISEKDPWAMRGYQLYGEVAEALGLTWGGRWKMMDFGHTELRLPGVMKR
jgi:peptidoglycan LD-endopeptidase CwlK